MKVSELDFTKPLPIGDFYGGVMGLRLRVHKAGCSWIFRYTPPTGGSRREMGLGVFDFVGPADAAAQVQAAQEAASAARALLIKGLDPIEVRKSSRMVAATSKVITFRSRSVNMLRLIRLYHEECIEKPDTGPGARSRRYVAGWITFMERVTPSWLLPMSPLEVTAKVVLRAIQDPGIADKLKKDQYLWRQRMSQCWAWLIFHGKMDANAAAVLRGLQPKWVAIYGESRVVEITGMRQPVKGKPHFKLVRVA